MKRLARHLAAVDHLAGSWRRADEAITALRDGTLHGKAVVAFD